MEKYRKMTPQDTVKLLYQSEFGGGHMISDKESARQYLLRELADLQKTEKPPTTEQLGDGAARINLASLPAGLSVDTLFSIFFESVPLFRKREDMFEKKLALPLALIEDGTAPFTLYEYNAYLERYFRAGGGAVHHSLAYSSAYRPSYRVVHKTFSDALEVFSRIDSLLAGGMRGFAVSVDGRCGSGKSTLASRLAAVYGCGVVHADDYYLPFSERRGQLGNLDAERMRRELSPDGGKIISRAYDPHTGAFVRETEIAAEPFFVIEGSYSTFVDHNISFALRVFVTTDKDEQKRRISERCPDKASDYSRIWIPAEEEYFKKYSVETNADIVVAT